MNFHKYEFIIQLERIYPWIKSKKHFTTKDTVDTQGGTGTMLTYPYCPQSSSQT